MALNFVCMNALYCKTVVLDHVPILFSVAVLISQPALRRNKWMKKVGLEIRPSACHESVKVNVNTDNNCL